MEKQCYLQDKAISFWDPEVEIAVKENNKQTSLMKV